MKAVFWLIILCGLAGMYAYYDISNYNSEEIAREAFDKINEYRIEGGLNTLVWDDTLAALATAHSQFMCETGNLQHSKHPYVENILQGGFHSEGAHIAEMWRDSPVHYTVLMQKDIQSGAVGVAPGIMQDYATFMAR